MSKPTAQTVKSQIDTHEAVCAERWRETILRIKRIEHINFSKILYTDRNFYGDIELIWKKNDVIHLNDKTFKKFLTKMQKKKIIVTPYLDAALIEKIYRGMGLPMPNER